MSSKDLKLSEASGFKYCMISYATRQTWDENVHTKKSVLESILISEMMPLRELLEYLEETAADLAAFWSPKNS